MLSLTLNNRYQVLETLGKGGFGETFLAIDTHLPSAKKCVIKQLKPAVRSHVIPDWLKERFATEAAILEELGEKHPQIPALYAYFSEGGDFYLVQEWIEGETLTQIHQRQGNLSPKQIQDILIGILPVLDYVHNRRIIHRDIKPDNIIIRSGDQKPVLIDFGIVKETVATMVHSNGNTPYSVGLGTPGYMASEQAAGRPIVSSDLYSLGLTAIFLLTGKTPQYLATDPNTGEVLWRKEAPNIKSNLGDVLDRTVRFHPRDRFSTAKEMLAALQVFDPLATAVTIAVDQQNSSLSPPSPQRPSNTTQENQPPWALLALGSFLAASAIIGGLMLGIVLGTKERSQPTSSPSVLPESPKETPTPELSPPKPRNRRPINNRRSQPSPTPIPTPEVEVSPTPEVKASPTPEVKASPTPEVEASPTPEVEASPTPEVEASPTPEVEASPTLTPIPEPTKAVPIPVEPPPQSSDPKETTEEQPSSPSIVIPNIPSQPSEEKPSQEEENNYNIQKYFESDREKNKTNIQPYFESDRE